MYIRLGEQQFAQYPPGSARGQLCALFSAQTRSGWGRVPGEHQIAVVDSAAQLS